MSFTVRQLKMLNQKHLHLAMLAMRRRRKGEHCAHEVRRHMHLAHLAVRLLHVKAKVKK